MNFDQTKLQFPECSIVKKPVQTVRYATMNKKLIFFNIIFIKFNTLPKCPILTPITQLNLKNSYQYDSLPQKLIDAKILIQFRT